MKKTFALIFLFFSSFAVIAQSFELTKNGKSDAKIILPSKATVTEIEAAKILQDYIQQISGALLPIQLESEPNNSPELLIGEVKRGFTKNTQSNDDAFVIEVVKDQIQFLGNGSKGTLYAVYHFLENTLACRKYSSKVTHVPQNASITVPLSRKEESPAFSFREVNFSDVYDPEYFNWHKLDAHGGENGEWGTWVHTFEHLLSPSEYGEEHPEYFAFYDDKRHAGMIPSWDGKSMQPESQLCLSNPDVLEVVCKNLQKDIERNPNAKYWSVSQNDNVKYCRCENCAALDSKYAAFKEGELLYGTHVNNRYSPIGMGSLLTFINKVAERFPDKIISTLAYQYTRVPPKNLVPRENVNIMLCSIESTRNLPIAIGDTAFSKDLKAWGQLTDNIIIWDYVIQFPHLISPFPNLKTLQPNVQFFKENNVSALFEQGNREVGGEFAELRAYLLAKLLWNPDLDQELLIDDFLKGFYSNAAPYIRQYIDLIHSNNMAETGDKLSIFASPVLAKDTYLKPELFDIYEKLFDQAETAVKNEPDVLLRVQTARMPLLYAKLEIAKAEKTGVRGAFDDNGFKAEIHQTLSDFYYNCLKNKVSRVSEWHSPPKVYAKNYLEFLNGL